MNICGSLHFTCATPRRATASWKHLFILWVILDLPLHAARIIFTGFCLHSESPNSGGCCKIRALATTHAKLANPGGKHKKIWNSSSSWPYGAQYLSHHSMRSWLIWMVVWAVFSCLRPINLNFPLVQKSIHLSLEYAGYLSWGKKKSNDSQSLREEISPMLFLNRWFYNTGITRSPSLPIVLGFPHQSKHSHII